MKKLLNKYWPVLVIFLIWFLFSSPYFIKGRVPFPSTYLATFFPPWSASYGMPVKNNAMPDVITQIYPWKKFTIDTWKSGSVPLWNPYSFSGTPHAGNYQSAVFTPFNLFFLLFSQIDAWSIVVLLQPLLAGLCMYLCLRGFKRSQSASLIGSIAFMFCGFIVVWMAYETLGYAALWLPLIFWGIYGYWYRPSRYHMLAVAIGIALSFVSGHFQTSLYVLGASVFFIVWKIIETKEWKKGWVLISFVFIGLFLAAPQLFLSMHAYQNSIRSSIFQKGEIIPWQYLMTLLAPDFYGNPVTRNDWFGHYAEWAGFIGIIPLLLGLYVCFRKNMKERWFFIVVALFSLFLAFPTPLSDLLYWAKIPVLATSAASRIIILVSFSLAVLAAYGTDALIDDWKKNYLKHTLWFVGTGFMFICIFWIILLFGKPFPMDQLNVAKRNFIIPSFVVILECVLFLVGFIPKKIIRTVVIFLFIAITSVDMLRFAFKWIPYDSKQYVYPPEKSLLFLQSKVGNERVFGSIGNEVGSMFSIPLIEGYDAVYQARYGQFIRTVTGGIITSGERSVVQFDKHGIFKTEALQLLGVRYIYHRLSDGRNTWAFPFWEYLSDGSMRQIYRDQTYEIFEYNNAFPRAFLVSSYIVASSDKENIAILFAKDFNRRDSVVLEESPVLKPQMGPGSAQIVSYTPNTVSILTVSAVPKILFLSDVYDPGWKVFIDSKESRIFRADYDFRAVSVPAGQHTILFRYEPIEFRLGLVFTAIGLLILLRQSRRKIV